MSSATSSSDRPRMEPLLAKSGLVYSERGLLTEVLCKPKLMPLKSITLQKMEKMEKKAASILSSQAATSKW